MNKLSYPDNFPKPIEKVLEAAKELIKITKNSNQITKDGFLRLNMIISHKHGLSPIPSWALYLIYLRNNELNTDLKKLLAIKNVRSQSGIVPVSIFTKQTGCPAHCIYCPTEDGVPKSYFSDEPAVMRAIRNDYDSYKQVSSRLMQLYLSGHSIEKIELIIQGGTFSAMDKKYREQFVKGAFDAANVDVEKLLESNDTRNTYCSSQVRLGENFSLRPVPSGAGLRSKNKYTDLLVAQKKNETAKQRIIGITIETRPDWCTDEEIIFLRSLGVTRVELGVQNLDDKILKLVKRGHGISAIIDATKKLKDAGIKVCYHMMPGLLGATPASDLNDIKKLFADEKFQPDLLKIYPCVVTRDSELAEWFARGEYVPYCDEVLTKLIIKIKKIIPPYVRIQRLVRDIPKGDIIAGSLISNLRQGVQLELGKQGARCRCIRCREVKMSNLKQKIWRSQISLRETKYQASDGREYFLEYIDPKDETLYALLRLRIPSYIFDKTKPLFEELTGAAIIRELHTYGLALKIGKNKKEAVQHLGLGQKLLKRAEEIARENKIKKIAVISGVGAREYYKKLGYRITESYMIKKITNS